MSTLRLAHIKTRIKQMNIPLRLKIEAKKKDRSLRHLSIALGMNHGFLSSKKNSHDLSATELVALSIYLDANLFDWFSHQLPENIRATKRETELLQQLAELQKQLAAVTEERNMFRDAVLKR